MRRSKTKPAPSSNGSARIKRSAVGKCVPFDWQSAGFKVPVPKDERGRLADLDSYEVLDTPPEEDFDNLTLLAAHICSAPIALISLIDTDRQWFKSKVGTRLSETPRDIAFCAHAILQTDLMIVPDATRDKRFAANPLVTRNPGVRFYAGAPLITPDQYVLGTLCVMDRVPRKLSQEQLTALRALSRQVMMQLDSRRRWLKMKRSLARARETEKDLRRQIIAAQRVSRTQGELLVRLSRQLRETVDSTTALIDRALAAELTVEQSEWLSAAKSSAAALHVWANDVQRLRQRAEGVS